jgi:hypothetical protein
MSKSKFTSEQTLSIHDDFHKQNVPIDDAWRKESFFNTSTQQTSSRFGRFSFLSYYYLLTNK